MSVAAARSCRTSVSVLEEITSVPLAFDRPLYRNYPGMKLGQRQPIDFFARLLADLAARIVHEDPGSWVITGPPYLNLPSAANLLARQVQRLLDDQGLAVALQELRLKPPDAGFRNGEEFDLICNYSRNSLHKRIEMREQVQPLLQTDALAAGFGGRHVLVINDINVTGTTQRFLQPTLTEHGARSCHWLYIFEVDPALALKSPEIEYQINNSQLQGAAAYAQVLCDPQTHPTARCLSRLLGQELADLRVLVSMLDRDTCARLHGLALLEGRYGSAYFSDKLDCLAAAARPHGVSRA